MKSHEEIPDGIYWVTFDNEEIVLLWKKEESLFTSKFLARSTLKRIIGHRPIKFEAVKAAEGE